MPDKFSPAWARARLSDWGALLLALMVMPGVFLGGLWATIGIGGGLVALFLGRVAFGRWVCPNKPLTVLVFSLLIWSLATSFMAIDPHQARRSTLELATILIPLLVLSDVELRASLAFSNKFSTLWPYVMGGMTLLLAAEIWLGVPLQHLIRGDAVKPPAYNRGFSYAMMLAWPAALFLAQQKGRKAVAGFVVMFVPCLLVTESRATLMATFLSVMIFVLARFMPRFVAYGLGLLATACSFWSFGARALFDHAPDWVAHLPASWRARVEIWDYMSYHIAENPWIGSGLGNSHKLDLTSPHVASYVVMHGPASHPHNAFTAFWVDLGVPGLLLGLVFCWLTLSWALRQDKKHVPYALALWGGVLTLSLCAYDVWTDSFLSMMALVMVVFSWVAAKGQKQP